MSARREPRRSPKTGKVRMVWKVHFFMKYPDGATREVRKVSPIQTKRGAEQWERLSKEHLLAEWTARRHNLTRKEVPTLTFGEWFNGRYWEEWVVGRKNKPSTVEGKRSVYKNHVEVALGHLRLDEINVEVISKFRASLVRLGRSEKTINNILAVVSKPLRYAFDVELITRAPKVGLFKIEAPEIMFWEFPEYARILAAAKREGPSQYAAVCLAGEAGLRVGEVKALRWREDVDMIARTITVNQQTCRGVTGTPKGRTRRTVPMTATLYLALKSLSVVREGLVIRGMPGSARSDENQIKNMMYRICRLAGLPERGWHCMRHSFGTHAAIFGVNPWRLQTWLGHKAMTETFRYVHVADAHMRELPGVVLEASKVESDPDRRVLAMLGARVSVAMVVELQQPYSNNKEAKPQVVGL